VLTAVAAELASARGTAVCRATLLQEPRADSELHQDDTDGAGQCRDARQVGAEPAHGATTTRASAAAPCAIRGSCTSELTRVLMHRTCLTGRRTASSGVDDARDAAGASVHEIAVSHRNRLETRMDA